MTTHPDRVATSQFPTSTTPRERRLASTTVTELQVAVLECRVAALEQQLVVEQERRQAVVDRYERLLAER